MNVRYNGKKLEISVKELGLFGMGRGLMFKSKNSENLLFNFRRGGRWSIHSYFVFFDFLALWLNEDNEVIEWQVVKPFKFKIRPLSRIKKLIEVPINSKNKTIVSFFVEKQRKV